MKTLVPGAAAGHDFPHWSHTLQDGRQVAIRPLTADDMEAERRFIQNLSPRSRHYRFLGQVSRPSDALLRQLTQLEYPRQVAFAAVPPGDPAQLAGVSRYSTDEQGIHCECAVTVADAWQHQGLGTLLMEHLIEVARSRGVRTMMSMDLADNVAMRELARDLGFHARSDPEDRHQVIFELKL